MVAVGDCKHSFCIAPGRALGTVMAPSVRLLRARFGDAGLDAWGYALSRWLMHNYGSASLGLRTRRRRVAPRCCGVIAAVVIDACYHPRSTTAILGQRVRTRGVLGIGEVMFAARFVLLYIVLVLFIFEPLAYSLAAMIPCDRTLHEASLTLALMLCSAVVGGQWRC